MRYKIITLITCLSLGTAAEVYAQTDSISNITPTSVTDSTVPEVNYARPITKTIADIKIIGAKSFDPDVLINLSGLAVGEEVQIPGTAITDAVNRFMRHGLFSNVRIVAAKYVGNKVWLEIHLSERPRIYKVEYIGIKKGDREELEKRTGLRKGLQLTPNTIDRTKQLIKKYYDEKGYRNMEIFIKEEPNLSEEGFVNVRIRINRNDKTKIENIVVSGNHALSENQVISAMKKTNEGFNLFKKNRFWYSIKKIFSQKKFVDKDYQEDLNNILQKYQELGYRDAEIVSDTIVPSGKKNKIDIHIKLNEGPKYYIDNVTFVGNTKFDTKILRKVLGLKKGDVYNQKKLQDRLFTEDDALSNLYYNNGYMFAQIDPVETKVDNDSVSLDIRIFEGSQATINKVIITGNTNVYEEVVRRELFTKPGALFSKEDIMNSLRVIAQLQQFDPEKMTPVPVPNPQTGTVDIEYQLVPKSSDQFNIALGWSQTGMLYSVGLKFTNFSIRNLFRPSMYHNFLPQGDGQTLQLNAQTNGRFYQSYSISFMDPWFGGRRPNLFSISAFYSKQTAIDTKFYNNKISSFYNAGYYGYDPYGYGGGYGYGGYGYGGGYGNYGNGSEIYEKAQDPDKYLELFGLSVGYGKRLSWPDNWFQVYASLNYTRYNLHNWIYDTFQNFHQGVANDINLQLKIGRNSTDNPIYTRMGSDFSLSVTLTPPYSLWDGHDYADPKLPAKDRYRFIEYHKWQFMGKVFVPLMNPATVKRTPVLMARIQTGFLGHYNSNKRSPFGTYYMGGDNMGAMGGYMNETIGLRGYPNGSIAGMNYNYAYSYLKVGMEIRYPILLENQTNIWVLGFIEAGNAWNKFADYNPFNLKRSAGLGARITIPMLGILGIDWGYGFDRPDGSRERGGSNVHFVIGQEF